MTIETEINKVTYVSDGQTTTLPVPFYFFDNEIAVYLNSDQTPLVQGTDYTVNNTNTQDGGEVVLTTAPLAGDKITIVRDVKLTQSVKFLEGENFPASDFEYSLDKIIMGLQQLKEDHSRMLQVPHNSKISQEEMCKCLSVLSDNLDKFIEYINGENTNTYYDIAINITEDSVVSDDTSEQYPYRLDIALNNVTEATIPTVIFNATDAVSSKFSPYAKTYDGGISIYLSDNEAYSTVIPVILLH